ncbi:MAG: hypothetical protein PGN26_07515 [Xylophilus ampelinus]
MILTHARESALREAAGLAQLVHVFHQEFGARRRAALDRCAGCGDAALLADIARPPGRGAADDEIRYLRQSILPADGVAEGCRQLRARLPALPADAGFDALLALCAAVARSVERLGPLWAHETALLLAAGRGRLPQRVHLTPGARAGARALGLPVRHATLPMHALHPAIRMLGAPLVEGFFDIAKGALPRWREEHELWAGFRLPGRRPAAPPQAGAR